MSKDLSVSIGSLRLPNPLIAASGCFGYGVEYSDVVDLATLGGVAVKGLFLAERQGHPPPRIVETPALARLALMLADERSGDSVATGDYGLTEAVPSLARAS